MYDILIIGGGAAGMIAAIAAKKYRKELSVAILERNDRVGKKIAVTGNGRCNITNADLSLARFHGENSGFAKFALSQYDLAYTLQFFKELGILIKFEEQGKGYPYSLQASSVVDALRFQIAELGIQVFPSTKVEKLEKGFQIYTDSEHFQARRVLVATGGYAAPKLGSDGLGCKILKEFGHTATKIFPAIVQLKTNTEYVRQLKGIKMDGTASILVNGKVNRVENGEILFTEYGISGPPILAFSRIAAENIGKNRVEVSIQLMPDYSRAELEEMIHTRVEQFPQRPLAEFFTGMLNKRVGQVVLKQIGKAINDPSSTLTHNDITKLAEGITDFRLTVKETTGFVNAQTTAGGIQTAEFFEQTMESKLHKGLYAAGEVLDIDGDCGGFNLQWAWSSGILAGISAAQSIKS